MSLKMKVIAGRCAQIADRIGEWLQATHRVEDSAERVQDVVRGAVADWLANNTPNATEAERLIAGMVAGKAGMSSSSTMRWIRRTLSFLTVLRCTCRSLPERGT